MMGSTAGVWLAMLCVCGILGAVAIRARIALRQLEADEERAFDLLVSDLARTAWAIARTRFLVQRHFGL